jgi:hypothetical protein
LLTSSAHATFPSSSSGTAGSINFRWFFQQQKAINNAVPTALAQWLLVPVRWHSPARHLVLLPLVLQQQTAIGNAVLTANEVPLIIFSPITIHSSTVSSQRGPCSPVSPLTTYDHSHVNPFHHRSPALRFPCRRVHSLSSSARIWGTLALEQVRLVSTGEQFSGFQLKFQTLNTNFQTLIDLTFCSNVPNMSAYDIFETWCFKLLSPMSYSSKSFFS